MRELEYMNKKKSIKEKKVIHHKSCAHFSSLFRDQRGISQRQLAEMIGVHHSAIGILEVGGYTLPIELMSKIWKVCDMDQKKFLLECLHNDLEKVFYD